MKVLPKAKASSPFSQQIADELAGI